MKRTILLSTVSFIAFIAGSCEKHSWNDVTEVVKEEVRDGNGKIVEIVETERIVEKGAKRFFIESHGKDDKHSEGK